MRKINRVWLAASVFSVVGMASAAIIKSESVLEEIAPYKSWTRVNPKPIQVDLASVAG